MMRFLVLLFCLFSFLLPAKASDYTDYCNFVVEHIIDSLEAPDNFLIKNLVSTTITIMPDGTVSDVKAYLLKPNGVDKLVKIEEEIKALRFPAHNSFNLGQNKPVIVSQRLIRANQRDVMQGEEFISSLRSVIKSGFKYNRPGMFFVCRVSYTVDDNAKLVSYHITRSSGSDSFDNAVEKHLDRKQKETLLYLPNYYRDNKIIDTVVFTSK